MGSKCIYCKGSIIKQKGSRLKVIGITKVTIPSPMHPIIPYNIILLEDEFGNRLPKKTMREFKIGDNYIEQKAKTDEAVSVVKIKYDIYEAIKESVELLNSFKFDKDDKILIKPSIIAAAYPYQTVNTNPDFLNALLILLLEYGIKKENIIVAEQALIGSNSIDSASKAGIIDVCKRHGIEFADISKGPFEAVEFDGYPFKIFKEALKRKLVNVPVMKTNFQIGISGAMENLSRLADEQTQRKMYYDGITKAIPKLARAINAFTIADASNGMQGQGPLSLGEPAFLNLVLSGKNAAALDKVFCNIAMLQAPFYVNASLPLKEIEVVGNEIDSLKYPIKAPVADETPHPDIKVIDGKACPACLNLMYGLTSRLVGLRGEQMSIVIGSMITEDVLKGKDRVIALGDCSIRKLQELKLDNIEKINEDMDHVEQLVLLKKLLTTKGVPKISSIDKVKSKMQMLLSKVVR
ncbi:DUF362 domain-containing protein [Candidatus Woesearchaeota archaeon]|nr:DUF362 domain-containing protein [Candidatus Woesearchaeota archaeon]